VTGIFKKDVQTPEKLSEFNEGTGTSPDQFKLTSGSLFS